ncbi:leucine-rich repeat domain-containing protein [Marinicellulosiphila megalodicopiae]|uniref:leucine-rich repeat domain-containing protein n=1 Tax=Marinicellulosiphila megalodicopiae TaxID=2724896 RepID=UPI003BB17481
MNRIFYVGTVLIIAAVISMIILNKNIADIQIQKQDVVMQPPKSIDQGIKSKESSGASKDEIEYKTQQDIQSDQIIKTPVKVESCVIDKGRIIKGNCKIFNNLEKMNLDRFTNLRLHDSFEDMLMKSQFDEYHNQGFLFLELGKSDQGYVYQVVSFDMSTNGEFYVFNSKLNKISNIVLQSEIDISIESVNGMDLINLDVTGGIKITKMKEQDSECLNEYLNIIYEENGYDSDYEKCSSDTELLGDFELIKPIKFENDELLSDFPIFEYCTINYNGEVVIIDKVTSIECNWLENIDTSPLARFTNLNFFTLRDSSADLSFLKDFKNIKQLDLRNIEELDVKLISNFYNLTDLIIINSKIVNVDGLNNSIFQLTNLKIRNSQLNELDFLKNQHALQVVSLIDLNLEKLPEFGSYESVKSLNIKNNSISDVDWFYKFTSLEELDMRNNNVKYMSQVSLENGVIRNFNITFNPLDCDDSGLYYSPIVKSSCNIKLKKELKVN